MPRCRPDSTFVNDEAVVAEAETIARELASGPTEAYGGSSACSCKRPTVDESQLEDERKPAAISRTADAQEGVKAFRGETQTVCREPNRRLRRSQIRLRLVIFATA
jgi:enoyl-CoA hydratase/carnithine racemase